MNRCIFLIVLGLSFTPLFSQTTDLQQLTSIFDGILAEHFKPDQPGATALVAKNGRVIYEKAVGMANLELDIPMKVDHVFRIASITKQFTAVAILQLMEKGKLNLQDDLTLFIPDYPTAGHRITIEHLLTHTSGILDYASIKNSPIQGGQDYAPAEMIGLFKNQPMRFVPGEKYEYSNSNYFLLGYILEKITGGSYAEYLQEHFFKHIGMRNSYYASDRKIIKNRVGLYTMTDEGYENAPYMSMTHPYAAGSIMSTVGDLFQWHQAVHSHKLISKESLESALTGYVLNDGTRTKYGYGWRLDKFYESPTIWHGGGINGAITMEMYLPEQDVFIAVFSNCDCNNPEEAVLQMATVLAGRPLSYQAINIDPLVLQDYAGVYEDQHGEIRIITVADNQLFSQRGRNPVFQIQAYAMDKFFFEDAPLTIEFIRNAEGKVDRLITVAREGNTVWKKTDKRVPADVELQVDENILQTYVGEYMITPDFSFTITREQHRLFVEAVGQEKFEIYAETETRFFSKVDDAQFEFVAEDTGKVIKTIIRQGGRQIDAMKTK